MKLHLDMKIVLNGQRIEEVKSTGSSIWKASSMTGKDMKTAFGERKTLLTGKLNLNLKKSLMKTPVWSVAL